MHVGLGLSIRRGTDDPRPLREIYRHYIDDAVIAEELGFDFVTASEHHFSEDSFQTSPLIVLANIAGRTSRIRLNTNVIQIPFYHPIRLAEDVAAIDNISGGRMELSVGAGSFRHEFDTFGIDPKQRFQMLFESLGLLRRCFSGERFDHEGKTWRFTGVRMTTPPVQTAIPLWVGGFGPKLVERAGREGYHLVGEPETSIDIYRAGRRAAGLSEDAFNFRMFMSGCLAEDEESAWDAFESGIRHVVTYYASKEMVMKHQPFVDKEKVGAFEPGKLAFPPLGEFRQSKFREMYPVGTPDQVLRWLDSKYGNKPLTHLGFHLRMPGMSTEATRTSMDLFAKEVMPVIRKWGRHPV
jgi:alkanesulfonate monooxygenase SsuD/methylene tetrahydromethanopterin reductase-like flavin-dependent oxidoreductase (luciferase family)